MTDSLIFRYHSINQARSGTRSLGAAIGHNKRLPPFSNGDNIDQSKSHLNSQLFNLPGTIDGVFSVVDARLTASGYKPRQSNAVIAVEFLFTLRHANQVPSLEGYFSDCAEWAAGILSGEILSADIHRDESYPHAHVIILLPLVKGGPSGSDLVGYHKERIERTKDFANTIGRKYGLRATEQKLSGSQKSVCAKQVIARLNESNDPIISSAIWPATQRAIRSGPEDFMANLGIDVPDRPSRLKTLEQIATSTGRGPKTRAAAEASDRALMYRATRHSSVAAMQH